MDLVSHPQHMSTLPISESQLCSRELACFETSGSGLASPFFQAPCCRTGSCAQIRSVLPGSWLQERLSGTFGIIPCPTATDPAMLKTLALGNLLGGSIQGLSCLESSLCVFDVGGSTQGLFHLESYLYVFEWLFSARRASQRNSELSLAKKHRGQVSLSVSCPKFSIAELTQSPAGQGFPLGCEMEVWLWHCWDSAHRSHTVALCGK